MTNFEWIIKEHKDIVMNCLSDFDWIVAYDKTSNKLTNCIDIDSCTRCLFHDNSDNCKKNIKKWLNEEYEPPKTLTKQEKSFLESLNESIISSGYLVRNSDGCLKIFNKIPYKVIHKDFRINNVEWNADCCFFFSISKNLYPDDFFSFISWDDEKPTPLSYLISLEVEN